MTDLAEALQRGIRLHNGGDLAEAERIYREILTSEPRHADALHLLGVIAHQAGRSDAGRQLIAQAIEINSMVPEYFNNLGNILKESGTFAEALGCYQRALALRPDFVDAHYNLGNAFAKEERLHEAIECYHSALKLRPEHPGSWINLGNANRSLGRIGEALSCYGKVSGDSPDFTEARWNRAIALLLAGDLARGWDEYESRWDLERARERRREFSVPAWNGEDISGRGILVHAEQGYGDSLQFLRYVPAVAERGARVWLECPPALARLAKSVEGVAGVIVTGEKPPKVAVHAPLLGLPRIFATRLETIPASVPYLRVPPKILAGWKKRVDKAKPGLKIGVNWAGGTSDPKRDCALAMLLPLARATEAVFFSLQKGAAAAQAAEPPQGMELIDFSPQLNDFADTAALICQLDLVISVDTSVAHLAGALGKPVWTLLRFAPDWRWMLVREDCPWYPSMRLFRQDEPGAWTRPIDRIASALSLMRSESALPKRALRRTNLDLF